MEHKQGSILDNFLNQFNDSQVVKAVPNQERDSQRGETLSPAEETSKDPISVERRKQIEFCHLLWEGACEKVEKAKAAAGTTGQPGAEDAQFLQEDVALRRKIFEQLQNPEVNFRSFALLVYKWRDMHIGRALPKKQALDIPLWPLESSGIKGGKESDYDP